MGLGIQAIKAIKSDMRDLKDELKGVAKNIKENTRQLEKVNQAIATEEDKKLKEIAKARQAEQFESSRYPLVETSESGVKNVEVDLTLKKLNIL